MLWQTDADCITRKPKSAANEKPKPAIGTKTSGTTTNGTTRGRPGRNRKPGRGRPKKKTAAELDAEMVDYFGVGEGGAANGTAQPAAAATNGDTGMVDEVM